MLGENRFSRYVCTGLLAVLAATASVAQETVARGVEVSVDPRVELVSIIFRLAGNREYGRATACPYIEEVDQQFGPFREHPVVQFAAQLKRSRGVSYDAPMSLAAFMKDTETCATLAPLEPWPATVDGRWTADDAREFLARARDFAQVSGFAAFFERHQPLYAASVARLEDLFGKEAHFAWFDAFFGERPATRFRVVISLLNGPNNYGARTDLEGEQTCYCVLGVWSVDGEGMPEFEKRIMPVVIHEFCHSYVNPLVYGHLAELEAPCKTLFASREKRMRRMAYPHWETMAHESLVRACVTRYSYDTLGDGAGDRQGQEEAGQGFTWVPDLAELLGEYAKQRDTYPSLEAFFPKILGFIESYAARPEETVNWPQFYKLLVSASLMVAVALIPAFAWKFRTGVAWRWLWAGAGLWTLGVALKAGCAVLLNKPLLGALKAALPHGAYVATGGVYIGLLTGVFEVGITLAAVLVWRQLARDGQRAVAVGLGAGCFEAFLIGLSLMAGLAVAVFNIPGTEAARTAIFGSSGTTALIWLIGPVERCIAICCHVASRTLVLFAAARRRWAHFWYGFLLLSAVDTVAGVYILSGAQTSVSAWWVEAAILPFAVASVPVTVWCLRHWPQWSAEGGCQ